jgi:hypothetical protein
MLSVPKLYRKYSSYSDRQKYKRLKLAGITLTTEQVTKLPLYHEIRKIGTNCFAMAVLTGT